MEVQKLQRIIQSVGATGGVYGGVLLTVAVWRGDEAESLDDCERSEAGDRRASGVGTVPD